MRKTVLLVACAALIAGSLVLFGSDAFAATAASASWPAHSFDVVTLATAGAAAAVADAPLKALLEARATIVGELQAMIKTAEDANRDFTEEEQKAYDAKKADLDAMNRRIGRMEDVGQATAALDRTRPAAARSIGTSPARAGGPEASREFSSLGEFMYAVRFRPNDQRLNFVEGVGGGPDLSAANDMRMDTGSTGGFAIPPQFWDRDPLQIPPQDMLVRPRAQVVPAGDPPDAPLTIPALDQTGAAPGNMFGGVSVQWIAEGGLKPQTDASLTDIVLEPHEVAGHVVVTDKLLRNWAAADPLLRKLLRGAVDAAEDLAFLSGDGTGKPLGVIRAAASYVVHRQNANQIVYIDLVNMVSRLLMRGGGNPIWSLPQQALPQIATLRDPLGNYIWKPIGTDDANAAQGFAGTLLGYPLRWNNRAPALGSLGDVVIADWSYYLIKDGSGPFVAASEHVYFTNNKTVIKIFWNVDGSPWLQAPFTEQNGYQVSPFVVLDVP